MGNLKIVSGKNEKCAEVPGCCVALCALTQVHNSAFRSQFCLQYLPDMTGLKKEKKWKSDVTHETEN